MSGWRRYALPVVLWVYGISVTVTLISLWGRAVVVDTNLISLAAEDASRARPIAEQIERWLSGQLRDVPGVDPTTADELATSMVGDAALQETLDRLVRDVVLAAAAPEGQAAVDVAGILSPAVPAITDHLREWGLPVTEEVVGSYVASLDPLVVREPGEEPAIGSESGTARSLSIATVIGLGLVLSSGFAAVRMAEDRRAMVRALFHRLALGALGFAVIFQLGSWILDPGAGRAPVRSAASRLVGAKVWLPLMVAAAAAGAGWPFRARRKRGGSDRGKRPGTEANQPQGDESHAGHHQQAVD
jgi:hypothetical protein